MTGVATWVDAAPDTSTVAGAKAVWKNLSDNLQAIGGLVKTSDTGQIDLVSGSWSLTINVAAGYEIYRFADSLHSTKPIYFKLEYGYGAALNRPAFWLTVGTGSNGAGTITGTMIPRTSVPGGTTSSSGAGSYTSFLSVQEGYLALQWMYGWAGSSNRGHTFILLERSRDDDGEITGDGLYWLTTVGIPPAIAGGHYSYGVLNSTTPAINLVGCMIPQLIISTAYSSNVQMYRHYVSTPRLRNIIGILTYITAEFGSGLAALVDIEVLSVTRTYLPLGVGATANGDQSGMAAVTIAIWWDS